MPKRGVGSGFDSKLVRLKAKEFNMCKHNNESFDSKLVRLKERHIYRRYRFLPGFDSKLVRLKGHSGCGQLLT